MSGNYFLNQKILRRHLNIIEGMESKSWEKSIGFDNWKVSDGIRKSGLGQAMSEEVRREQRESG